MSPQNLSLEARNIVEIGTQLFFINFNSARFYVSGNQGIYPVTSFLEPDDIDLTSKHEIHHVPFLITRLC